MGSLARTLPRGLCRGVARSSGLCRGAWRGVDLRWLTRARALVLCACAIAALSCRDTAIDADTTASGEADGGPAVDSRDSGARPDVRDAADGLDAADGSECGTAVTIPCSGDMPEKECAAANGYYRAEHRPRCACPTSDGSCPCTRTDECQGLCVGDPALDATMCTRVTEGRCSPFTAVSACVCLLGPVQGIPEGTARLRCF
jgi:hypothetical protein